MNEEDLVVDTLEQQEDTDTDIQDENVDELKERLAKAEELAKNYKIRAEKAEKNHKKEVVQAPQASTELPLTTDAIALLRAGVPEEDESVVLKYAKGLGVTVKEALQDDVVKEILKRNAEERKSNSAAHTGDTRRGTAKVSDEQLLLNASKGDLPDSDEEMKRLIALKRTRNN